MARQLVAIGKLLPDFPDIVIVYSLPNYDETTNSFVIANLDEVDLE